MRMCQVSASCTRLDVTPRPRETHAKTLAARPRSLVSLRYEIERGHLVPPPRTVLYAHFHSYIFYDGLHYAERRRKEGSLGSWALFSPRLGNDSELRLPATQKTIPLCSGPNQNLPIHSPGQIGYLCRKNTELLCVVLSPQARTIPY